MAPRRKPKKKKGNTRMDGAIEAMTKEYGFSDVELVRKVVRELLQAYGGDQGWFFIEQYSYRELLEALLRHQNKNGDGKPGIRDNLPEESNDQDDSAEGEDLLENDFIEREKANEQEHTSTDVTGPSCVLPEETCPDDVDKRLETIKQEDEMCLVPVNIDGKSWSFAEDDMCSVPVNIDGKSLSFAEDEMLPLPVNIDGKSCNDIGFDQLSSWEKSDTIYDKEETSNFNLNDDKSSIPVLTAPMCDTPIPPVPSALPSKRHQPSYGWIKKEEECINHFLEFAPAAEWQDIKPAKRKSRWDCKSRWDLRPQDP